MRRISCAITFERTWGRGGDAVEWLWLLPILALPAIGALVLFFAMDRWGKRHDPMGGTSEDILPIGRARQSDVYRD